MNVSVVVVVVCGRGRGRGCPSSWSGAAVVVVEACAIARRGQAHDDRQGQRRNQHLEHLAAGLPVFPACGGHGRIEQLPPGELLQGQLHRGFGAGQAQFLFHEQGQIGRRVFAVAVLPDETGHAIQAVRLVALQIIDQQFVGQLLHDQIIRARFGKHPFFSVVTVG